MEENERQVRNDHSGERHRRATDNSAACPRDEQDDEYRLDDRSGDEERAEQRLFAQVFGREEGVDGSREGKRRKQHVTSHRRLTR